MAQQNTTNLRATLQSCTQAPQHQCGNLTCFAMRILYNCKNCLQRVGSSSAQTLGDTDVMNSDSMIKHQKTMTNSEQSEPIYTAHSITQPRPWHFASQSLLPCPAKVGWGTSLIFSRCSRGVLWATVITANQILTLCIRPSRSKPPATTGQQAYPSGLIMQAPLC